MGPSVKIEWEKSTKPVSKPATKKKERSSSKPVVLGGAIVAIIAIIGGLALMARSGLVSSGSPPEEIAAEVLEALSSGNRSGFLEHVDVKAFVSLMDSTGITRRDYAEADADRREELELIHAELLAQDIFVSANTGKQYTIAGRDITDTSAKFLIKPWIQFGNRLYKRLVMEKRGHGWKLIGLASPDA